MKRNEIKWLAACAAVAGAAFAAVSAQGVPDDGARAHRLVAKAPAEDSAKGWERESYPIGNGWFGVSVFGGVPDERFRKATGYGRA